MASKDVDTEENHLNPGLRNRYPTKNSLQNGVPTSLAEEIGFSDQHSLNEAFNSGMNEVLMKHTKERIEQLRMNIISKIDSQMFDFTKELQHELESLKSNNYKMNSLKSSKDKKSLKKSSSDDELPEKEFIVRESLLTELLEISHIRTIYHIFVAMLVILFLQTFSYDLIETGKFNLDYGMIMFAFGKLQLVIMIWLCMKLSVILLIFPAFHFWAYNRKSLRSQSVMDTTFTFSFILYLVLLLYVPAKLVVLESIPPASSAIILCEQVRLIMKSYAFVRSNVPRAKGFVPQIKQKNIVTVTDTSGVTNSDSEDAKTKDLKLNQQPSTTALTKTYDSPCPHFSNFLYFLFAPTLIYRDSYPRMPGPIRWRYVTSNFVQVVACLFYTYYIFQRFCVPVFRRFGHEPISYRGLLLSVFGCMMPATLVLLIHFYLLLHAWMNAFAEMFRFGDRMFYKDWWNSTTYANYYRTWNIVVHDWLYTYIYRDCYRFFKPNRRLPMMLVFFLSALVHEYIVSLMFSYFYPVMLVLFLGMGVFFMLLTDKRESRFWNIFFWVNLFIGPGIFMSLYCVEIYARTNCPQYYKSAVLDFFVPRSWVCQQIEATEPL